MKTILALTLATAILGAQASAADDAASLAPMAPLKVGDIVASTLRPAEEPTFGKIIEIKGKSLIRVQWIDPAHAATAPTDENTYEVIPEKHGCEGLFCPGGRIVYNWGQPTHATIAHVFTDGRVFLSVENPADPKNPTVVVAPRMPSEKNPNGDSWFGFHTPSQDGFFTNDKVAFAWPRNEAAKILELYSDGHALVQWKGSYQGLPDTWVKTSDLRLSLAEGSKIEDNEMKHFLVQTPDAVLAPSSSPARVFIDDEPPVPAR